MSNQRQIDIYDVLLVTAEGLERGRQLPANSLIQMIEDGSDPGHTPLVDTVAGGRLFLLNGKGELEKVILAVYWKEGGILTVTDKGEEFDEDGTVTRSWK